MAVVGEQGASMRPARKGPENEEGEMKTAQQAAELQ